MAYLRSRTILFITDDGEILEKVLLSSDVFLRWKKYCRVFEFIDECEENTVKIVLHPNKKKYVLKKISSCSESK